MVQRWFKHLANQTLNTCSLQLSAQKDCEKLNLSAWIVAWRLIKCQVEEGRFLYRKGHLTKPWWCQVMPDEDKGFSIISALLQAAAFLGFTLMMRPLEAWNTSNYCGLLDLFFACSFLQYNSPQSLKKERTWVFHAFMNHQTWSTHSKYMQNLPKCLHDRHERTTTIFFVKMIGISFWSSEIAELIVIARLGESIQNRTALKFLFETRTNE